MKNTTEIAVLLDKQCNILCELTKKNAGLLGFPKEQLDKVSKSLSLIGIFSDYENAKDDIIKSLETAKVTIPLLLKEPVIQASITLSQELTKTHSLVLEYEKLLTPVPESKESYAEKITEIKKAMQLYLYTSSQNRSSPVLFANKEKVTKELNSDIKSQPPIMNGNGHHRGSENSAVTQSHVVVGPTKKSQ